MINRIVTLLRLLNKGKEAQELSNYSDNIHVSIERLRGTIEALERENKRLERENEALRQELKKGVYAVYFF